MGGRRNALPRGQRVGLSLGGVKTHRARTNVSLRSCGSTSLSRGAKREGFPFFIEQTDGGRRFSHHQRTKRTFCFFVAEKKDCFAVEDSVAHADTPSKLANRAVGTNAAASPRSVPGSSCTRTRALRPYPDETRWEEGQLFKKQAAIKHISFFRGRRADLLHRRSHQMQNPRYFPKETLSRFK